MHLLYMVVVVWCLQSLTQLLQVEFAAQCGGLEHGAVLALGGLVDQHQFIRAAALHLHAQRAIGSVPAPITARELHCTVLGLKAVPLAAIGQLW